MFLLVSVSTKQVLSGGCEKSVVTFLFAGLLLCFCVYCMCVFAFFFKPTL